MRTFAIEVTRGATSSPVGMALADNAVDALRQFVVVGVKKMEAKRNLYGQYAVAVTDDACTWTATCLGF